MEKVRAIHLMDPLTLVSVALYYLNDIKAHTK